MCVCVCVRGVCVCARCVCVRCVSARVVCVRAWCVCAWCACVNGAFRRVECFRFIERRSCCTQFCELLYVDGDDCVGCRFRCVSLLSVLNG